MLQKTLKRSFIDKSIIYVIFYIRIMNRKVAFTVIIIFIWTFFLDILVGLFGNNLGYILMGVYTILSLAFTYIYICTINDNKYSERNQNNIYYRMASFILFSFSFLSKHYGLFKENDFKDKEFSFYLLIITCTLPIRIILALFRVINLILLKSTYLFSTKKPS
jgi:hypothetical protein